MTLYTIGHLAKQYGVSTSTIRRWADIDGFESKTMPEITNAKSLVRHEFRPVLQFSGALISQVFLASLLCR